MLKKKALGFRGVATFSGHHMTTGFGPFEPFELPARGLLHCKLYIKGHKGHSVLWYRPSKNTALMMKSLSLEYQPNVKLRTLIRICFRHCWDGEENSSI